MGAALDPDLHSTLAAAPLARDVVTVSGEEALPYLQGQLSQDVDGLAVGGSAPALLLQPTGKMVAWVRVTRTGEEELRVDVDAGAGEEVAARLRRFLLRTRATVDVATWTGLAVRGPGADGLGSLAPEGGLVVDAGWPGVAGVDVLGPEGVPDGAAGDVPLASAGALEALRIECGVPAFGAEITDATIPAELGPWVIERSVSFTKGCYAGQELVARVDSRGGNVPRPVRGLRVDGPVAPVPGAAVVVDGSEVGTVTSAAVSPTLGAVALAPLRRSVEPGQRVELRPGDEGTAAGAATVSELPLR